MKPYTDRTGNERLRINMTMPKGTMVGGKDLSGMKVSMPAREFMKQDKDAGKPVRYGFRSDRDVHFFKYDEQNRRIDYPAEGDPAIMPSDLAAAVAAAYQNRDAAKSDSQRDASREYTGLTFAPCDMKVKTVSAEGVPDKNFLLCKLPPHTTVGNRDLGGMIVSKFLTDRQLAYAQSGKPFTASFKSAMPVRVYPVNGDDSRDNFDYDFRNPQEFSAAALVAGIEDAYDARLLNARGYEDGLEAAGMEMAPAAAAAKQMLEDRDAAASRQGSKDAALEYHRTGGGEDMPLGDLCDAKSDEAADLSSRDPSSSSTTRMWISRVLRTGRMATPESISVPKALPALHIRKVRLYDCVILELDWSRDHEGNTQRCSRGIQGTRCRAALPPGRFVVDRARRLERRRLHLDFSKGFREIVCRTKRAAHLLGRRGRHRSRAYLGYPKRLLLHHGKGLRDAKYSRKGRLRDGSGQGRGRP